MPSGFFTWSHTPNDNADADSAINYREGQAPSSVNDSARAAMAVLAKYRDDITGAIVTGGTGTAYTVSTFTGFDTLADMNGQMVAFTPHATNGATVTLNVDGLGAKPLRPSPGVELAASSLILGTPYVATYNNSDAVWYLHSGAGSANAYSIPLGAGMDYWLPTAPSSIFAFPIGQAISRTTYAALFAAMGTTYGTGDGSTTFNLPDRRGRVSAQLDSAGVALTSFSISPDANTLGGKGGTQGHALTVNEMPTHNHHVGINDPGHTHSHNAAVNSGGGVGVTGGGSFFLNGVGAATINGSPTGIQIVSSIGFDQTENVGGGAAHAIVQPTIMCNYILRVQ